MSSSGGNSSSGTGTSQLNSGSDGDLQVSVDQRKRKRMQSNRESARRSRMRKQKHLDDLAAQAAQLSKDNTQILTSIDIATRSFMTVEAENQILRAQMVELNQRLRSLDEILHFIGDNGTMTSIGAFDRTDCVHTGDSFVNPFNLPYLNLPIMASADMFQY